MAASVNNEIHGVFIVMNQAAVDIANHTAVASVDTAIDVEAADGEDQFPLKTTDYVVLVGGFAAINAGLAIQSCVVTDANTLTLRTTNPSAGAIDPASIAANLLKFLVFRP